MKSFQKYLILCVILTFILVGFVIFKTFLTNKTQTDISIKSISKTNITPMPTLKENWRRHTNEQYNISFKYPKQFTPNESGRIFTSGAREFRFLIDDTTPDKVVPALKAESQVVIDNLTWNIANLSNTNNYCDAGICESTGTTYYLYKNGYLIRIIYYSKEMQPIIEQIISSIAFASK